MLKKLLLLFLVFFLAVFSVAIVRTFMHVATQIDSVELSQVQIDKTKVSNNLAASIRFKTISYQDIAKFPKKEFENFIRWAALTYPEFHQATQLEQLDYSLLFKWEGRDTNLAPILFEGHHDVVPIIPGSEELWEEKPFAGVISNNRIWGRGTLDDKSGVIGLMEAATHLIKNNYQPKRTVYFAFGHDEEVGGSGAAIITEKLRNERIQL